MATDKQTADAILAKIAAVADARMRPMFGGYVIYVDEKVIGQFDDNQLFIKTTPFGEQHAPELERASPYPGAKPAFIARRNGWKTPTGSESSSLGLAARSNESAGRICYA